MSSIDTAEVKFGSHLTLHYRLALPSGEDIVNTFTSKPATVLVGAGQMAAPLEEILLGMQIRSRSVFQLTPQQAFGLRNPALIQKLSLETLRANGTDSAELVLGDLVEFNAPDGERYTGVLKELGADYAIFDFNHPLAGQSLTFEVQIIGIL